MKKIIILSIFAMLSLAAQAQYSERNGNASCDSTCFAPSNSVSSSNNHVMPGTPVMEKTIPVYMLEPSGRVQNGTMLIRQIYLNDGTPQVQMANWNKQYALSNPKNKFTFNAVSFADITYVEVLNFDAGS